MKNFEFHYARWYYLTHPWKIAEDIYYGLKWMAQRAFRGWDDRVVWSIDYYLCQMLPIWLERLKENKIGIPISFCGDKVDMTDEDFEESEALWTAELDKMIAGFRAGYELSDVYDANKMDELMKTFDEGMESFHKYFFNLWD